MEPTLRPIRPEDLEAVHRLKLRCEAHDGLPMVTPLDEFREWLDDPHLDLAADTRLVEAGGEVVAWGRVWHRPSTEREARAFLMGAVDPGHRGRGIGSALLRWEIGRGEALLAQAPADLPRHLRAQGFDFQHGALRLYERHGLLPVRWIDELLCPLDTIPPRPETPGIAIVRWDPAHAEAARVTQNEAFADHWGSTPLDAAAWTHLLKSFGTRLDLSFLALDGDRVVGVCRNGHFPADEAVTGRRDGWVFHLGVARSHRNRGIASGLIQVSHEVFRAAGFTHAALGVDSENPTGAWRLYARLGYRPKHRAVVHQRRVPGDASGSPQPRAAQGVKPGSPPADH
jgi:mycothiol synthase